VQHGCIWTSIKKGSKLGVRGACPRIVPPLRGRKGVTLAIPPNALWKGFLQNQFFCDNSITITHHPDIMAGKALIVLATPWWTPEINRGRASVLPFFQGLVNFVEHFSVYHSNFYEGEGFKAALVDDLTHTKEVRLYLYIAAHGLSSMIGGSVIVPL
jgi:hypothetical protein